MNAKDIPESRLNQYIASCGVCSRREADRMIEAGRVNVNGIPAVRGMRVKGTDEVTVDGRPLAGALNKIVVAFYRSWLHFTNLSVSPARSVTGMRTERLMKPFLFLSG